MPDLIHDDVTEEGEGRVGIVELSVDTRTGEVTGGDFQRSPGHGVDGQRSPGQRSSSRPSWREGRG